MELSDTKAGRSKAKMHAKNADSSLAAQKSHTKETSKLESTDPVFVGQSFFFEPQKMAEELKAEFRIGSACCISDLQSTARPCRSDTQSLTWPCQMRKLKFRCSINSAVRFQ